MNVSRRARVIVAAAAWLGAAIPATTSAQPATAPGAYAITPAEPDFALTVLPTALRMPTGEFAFRLTHRFSRPIAGTCPDEGPKPEGCGGLGAFVENFFGFDSSSKVGLEFRYGLAPGVQMTLHRTNDRALQVAVQGQVLRQHDTSPITVDVIGAVEGLNNFRQDHAFTVGAVISHRVRTRGALYLHPLVIINSRPDQQATLAGDNHTMMLGVGGRIRIASRTSLVAEAAPRLDGYRPNVDHVAFGIERRTRGHVFQLTVSNSFASTLRQAAHGGPGHGDWFIGFTLSRKFY